MLADLCLAFAVALLSPIGIVGIFLCAAVVALAVLACRVGTEYDKAVAKLIDAQTDKMADDLERK